jgi:hypothetical protein
MESSRVVSEIRSDSDCPKINNYILQKWSYFNFSFCKRFVSLLATPSVLILVPIGISVFENRRNVTFPKMHWFDCFFVLTKYLSEWRLKTYSFWTNQPLWSYFVAIRISYKGFFFGIWLVIIDFFNST